MSQSELTRMLEAETLAQDPAEERVPQRLKDYWNTLRGGQQFPSRANFRMEAVTGLGPHAFALDLAQGADDPVFRFVGKALTDDCGKDFTLKPLSAVPPHTLLAEVARRYTDVVDRKTPLEFAEEHVGADGTTALFRGAMLPFSEDGQTLDFIVGAITYKKKPSETTLAAVPAPLPAAAPAADTARADDEPAVAASAVGHVSGLPRLSQSLEECQALAREVVQADSKSRETLYRAVESAYAFYFECEADPEAYAELRTAAGIGLQVRAPFTPIVKLVFGVDYDKTRLSEYATALCYAHRNNRTAETVKSFIETHEGGIKGCVKAERAARRSEKGARRDDLEVARGLLRQTPAIGRIPDANPGKAEFVVMLGRRAMDDGATIDVLRVLDEKRSAVEAIVKRTAKTIAKELAAAGAF
ncbi:MAG: PAS domain-containing protein [Rhodospirillales bacterium]